MKIGLIWGGVVLLGAYIANGYIASDAVSAAVAVGLVVWFLKEHT